MVDSAILTRLLLFLPAVTLLLMRWLIPAAALARLKHSLEGRTAPFLLLLLILGFSFYSFYAVHSLRHLQYFSLGGIIPLSDAAGYTEDAFRLLEQGQLGFYGGRRPLFPIFLSNLLWITGGNLVGVTCILGGLTAALLVRVSFHVYHIFGLVSALWFAAVVLCFVDSNVTGLLMTESLGLMFALLSLILLLEGIYGGSNAKILSSIFFLGLAQCARPGGLILLAAFPLACADVSLRQNLGSKIRATVVMSAPIALALIANGLVMKVLASPNAIQFASIGHTLYGLTSGGRGWTAVFQDHQYLLGLPENEAVWQMLKLSWHQFLANPFDLLGALGQGLEVYVLQGGMNAFIAPLQSAQYLRLLAAVVFEIPIALEMGVLLRKRSHPFFRILVLSVAGIILSLSFLIDGSYRARALASSIPIMAVTASLLFSRSQMFDGAKPGTMQRPSSSLLALGITVLSLLPLGHLFAHTAHTPGAIIFAEGARWIVPPQSCIRAMSTPDSWDSQSFELAQMKKLHQIYTPKVENIPIEDLAVGEQLCRGFNIRRDGAPVWIKSPTERELTPGWAYKAEVASNTPRLLIITDTNGTPINRAN